MRPKYLFLIAALLLAAGGGVTYEMVQAEKARAAAEAERKRAEVAAVLNGFLAALRPATRDLGSAGAELGMMLAKIQAAGGTVPELDPRPYCAAAHNAEVEFVQVDSLLTSSKAILELPAPALATYNEIAKLARNMDKFATEIENSRCPPDLLLEISHESQRVASEATRLLHLLHVDFPAIVPESLTETAAKGSPDIGQLRDFAKESIRRLLLGYASMISLLREITDKATGQDRSVSIPQSQIDQLAATQQEAKTGFDQVKAQILVLYTRGYFDEAFLLKVDDLCERPPRFQSFVDTFYQGRTPKMSDLDAETLRLNALVDDVMGELDRTTTSIKVASP